MKNNINRDIDKATTEHIDEYNSRINKEIAKETLKGFAGGAIPSAALTALLNSKGHRAKPAAIAAGVAGAVGGGFSGVQTASKLNPLKDVHEDTARARAEIVKRLINKRQSEKTAEVGPNEVALSLAGTVFGAGGGVEVAKNVTKDLQKQELDLRFRNMLKNPAGDGFIKGLTKKQKKDILNKLTKTMNRRAAASIAGGAALGGAAGYGIAKSAAKKNGKKVELNKPKRTPKGHSKKFYVYVKDGDKIKKVTFGDPNMKIKKDNPKARKSFRARHNCDNPGPKTKARYWSCKMW